MKILSLSLSFGNRSDINEPLTGYEQVSSKLYKRISRSSVAGWGSLLLFYGKWICFKYQGVKEFHMLARIGCFKNYGFQSF